MSDATRLRFKVKCPHCGEKVIVTALIEEPLPEVEPEPSVAPPPASPEPEADSRELFADFSPDDNAVAESADLGDELDFSPEEEAFRNSIVRIILNREFDLPMLPHVALKVIRLTSDPDTSAHDLAKVILTDQTIVTKIIQIANSPVYAGTVETTNINQALVRLGQTEVKNLMLAISLETKIFKSRLYSHVARAMWERAVGVAFGARLLASALKFDKDEAFLCGLMHNLGRMIGLTVIETAQRDAGPDFRPTRELVESVADQYQGDIGELTVEKWQLPDIVGQVIRFYLRPEDQQQPQPIVAVVSVAERFCRLACVGSAEPEEIDLSDHAGAKMLRLSPEQINDLYERFTQVYQGAKAAFD